MELTNSKQNNLAYEITSEPFRGSKILANASLKKVQNKKVSHGVFIEYLKEHFSEWFPQIEWLRFHSVDKIAIFYILPFPATRKGLFENREQITVDTGWYPLIMGERAEFNQINPENKDINLTLKEIGKLTGFKVHHNNDGEGVSFELLGTDGNYLFDFGYSGSINIKPIAAFLSHFHSDHSGGIEQTLRSSQSIFPVFCSKSTALLIKNNLNAKISKEVLSNIIYPESEYDYWPVAGFKVSFFNIYHSPESIGFCISDSIGTSFFYFGDLCLKNGYADFRTQIVDLFRLHKTKRNNLLLDGAMIGRNNFIENEDTPESVLEEFSANVNRRNIFIIGNQPENLIYSYMTAYKITQENEKLKKVKIIVSPRLLESLKLILEPIVKDMGTFKDPVFKHLFGESKSNPVETHRLYPLSENVLSAIDPSERLIFFISNKELQHTKYLTTRLEKSDVVLTGTFALRENLPDILSKTKPRTILRVSSANWGFHSAENDIKEFIESILDKDLKVYLFHNFKDRLDKFIKKNNFNKESVIALPNCERKISF